MFIFAPQESQILSTKYLQMPNAELSRQLCRAPSAHITFEPAAQPVGLNDGLGIRWAVLRAATLGSAANVGA